MSIIEDVCESFIELGRGIKEATVELAEGMFEIVTEDIPSDLSDAADAVTATAVVATAAAIVKNPVTNLAGSFVDNVFREQVEPVEGSVVYCDLHLAEHSGIYVGDNQIVHLNGYGEVESVAPGEFIARLDGFNTALSVYVSCNDNEAVGSQSASCRAMDMLGSLRDYNFLIDNCHQFTAGCLTGDFEDQNNFLWMLKDEAQKHLGADSWRVWELSPEELFD